MSAQLDEIVSEFLVESHEQLDSVDRALLALAAGEGDPAEGLALVFRIAHTIKGTCGFLGFSHLESLTHAGENLLGKLRDEEVELTRPVVDILFQMVDAVRKLLARIESQGNDTGLEFPQLLAALKAAQSGAAVVPAVPAPPMVPPPGPVSEEERRVPAVPQVVPPPPAAASAPVAPPAPVPAPTAEGPASAEPAEAARDSRVAGQHVRIDVGVLDRLMNLVGELVVVRNQILQSDPVKNDAVLATMTQRLSMVTSDLRADVMKTRMQPVDTLWNKVPRQARDVAQGLGKQVAVHMEGGDTELDRSVIEAIKDPLTHIVRNCIDHGIESPGARAAAGKPAQGNLTLRAYHAGGHVMLEIEDDGKGVDLATVRRKGIERGLMAADHAARASERELLNLLFLPGFSTASQVSNLSGRGVGMDVVRTNVERIGGTVEVRTDPGRGTAFQLQIPLTLAIVPALIVRTGGERFALPQVSLVEVLRLRDPRQVELVQGTPVYRLRGRLLPLCNLGHVLGIRPASEEASHIIVLQAGARRFGLVVDAIGDTEEIVVKALGRHVKDLGLFAGAAVMSDGRVALILDVGGLAGRVGLLADGAGMRDAAATTSATAAERELLVFTLDGEGRHALPLGRVTRLEDLPTDSIETVAGYEFVQYRGYLMPIVRILDVLPERRVRARGQLPPSDLLQVVVHQHNGHPVGLVVGQILDALSAPAAIMRPPARAGSLGSLVVDGRITELLDLDWLVACSTAAEAVAGAGFPGSHEQLLTTSDPVSVANMEMGTTR